MNHRPQSRICGAAPSAGYSCVGGGPRAHLLDGQGLLGRPVRVKRSDRRVPEEGEKKAEAAAPKSRDPDAAKRCARGPLEIT